MAVGLSQPENILPVAGVQLATLACGIKKAGKKDLVLIQMQNGATCAATFTRNEFCAAPVVVAKKHLKSNSPKALLINSGNANAGTGARGLENALQSCQWVADKLGCEAEEVLPFSTGVIGEHLPMSVLKTGIDTIVSGLDTDMWLQAAHGIMTTDTIAKAVSKQVQIQGETITITGIAKGSGMICPNMATLLSYIATDANVERDFLQRCLTLAVNKSFNSITVDGDTSTNDSCVLIATGAKSSVSINSNSDGSDDFLQAISDVCMHLAHSIIRDGEGATKFVTVAVESSLTEAEARDVAFTIAHSPLVKTALFASDPNWGRILAAVGRAGIGNLAIDKVNIYLDDVCIVNHGGRDADYREEMGKAVMSQDEITIRVVLNRGDAEATIWTTDLSHDYVSINADYRS